MQSITFRIGFLLALLGLLGLLGLFGASIAGAAETGSTRFGDLILTFPPDWKFRAVGNATEGQGPSGETVLLTVRQARANTSPEQVEQGMQAMKADAPVFMNQTARQLGLPATPVTTRELEGGRQLHSMQSQVKKEGRDYYVLQYLFVAQRSAVFIALEGHGTAEEASARFGKILATRQWVER